MLRTGLVLACVAVLVLVVLALAAAAWSAADNADSPSTAPDGEADTDDGG